MKVCRHIYVFISNYWAPFERVLKTFSPIIYTRKHDNEQLHASRINHFHCQSFSKFSFTVKLQLGKHFEEEKLKLDREKLSTNIFLYLLINSQSFRVVANFHQIGGFIDEQLTFRFELFLRIFHRFFSTHFGDSKINQSPREPSQW